MDKKEKKELFATMVYVFEKRAPVAPHKYIDMYGMEQNGCPSCYKELNRNEILYAGQAYCSVCGQCIDWGKDHIL